MIERGEKLDVVAWNTSLHGYCSDGPFGEAAKVLSTLGVDEYVYLFKQTKQNKQRPNVFQ